MISVYFSLLIALIAGYCLWRWVQYHRAEKLYEPHFPPPHRLTWKASSPVRTPTLPGPVAPDGLQSDGNPPFAGLSMPRRGPARPAAGGERLYYVGAAADGLLQGLPAFKAFQQLDTDVLNAIEFSTSADLNDLASIADYIDARFFQAPAETAEGWFHRLVGYIGEQKAAAALESRGHHVEFAPTPNQAGWDLLVDGEPFNVKVGEFAARQGKEFLASHDGIGLVTSAEAGSEVLGAKVYALPDLDHLKLEQAARQTLDGVHDGFHPEFHFPLLTTILSCFREFGLLQDQKIDIERALKHVAVDAASVGLGGFAGAKVGTTIGCILGPIGAALGGLFGSVAGAVGGKALANAVRYRAFNRAKDACISILKRARVELNEHFLSSQREIRALQVHYERRFCHLREALLRRFTDQLSGLRAQHETALRILVSLFPVRLRELEERLLAEERDVLMQYPRSRFGFLFPAKSDLARSVVRAWFRRARSLVRSERNAFLRGARRPVEEQFADIRRFLETYEVALDSLARDIEAVVQVHKQSEARSRSLADHTLTALRAARESLIREFHPHAEAIVRRVLDTAAHWRREIRKRKRKLLREAAAVGLDDRLRAILQE